MWWAYVVGFGLALLFNQSLTRLVSSSLWRGMEWRGSEVADPHWHAWHPRAIGAIEAVLFAGSVTLKHPEFIAIWLGLKVAGSWQGWAKDQKVKLRIKTADAEIVVREFSVPGRTVFNVFLIGTALSLIGGCTGGQTITWLLRHDFVTTVVVWYVLAVGTSLLLAFAQYYQNKWPKLQSGEELAD